MKSAITSEAASTWRDSVSLLRGSAGLGTLAWLASRVLLELDLVKSTLFMGLVVVVPLALSLLPPGPGERLFGWMSVLQPLAGFGAAYSLVLQPRMATAVFTIPWLCLGGLSLALGVSRGRAQQRAVRELPWALGLALLPMGAAWLFVSRAGLDPLNTGSLIVMLTAVHFHFAAFAALAVVACTARLLELGAREHRHKPGLLRLVRLVALGLCAGVFLVALGIAGVPALGLLGAAALTLALFTNASLMLFYARRSLESRLARMLLVISGFSVLLSMPMALGWAYGEVTVPWVGMEWMLRIHGMANAHGFVLSGLLAFWLEQRRKPDDE